MTTSTSASGTENGTSLLSPLLLPPPPPPKIPESDSAPEKLLIDDILQRYCGEFGPWQLCHFVLTSLAWALEGFHTMVMIFSDREPDWTCLGPGCDPQAKNVCGFEPGSWTWIGGADSSIVSQWGLVCENKYKVGLVQAMFFCGCMIGAGVFGHLSDSKLGRKGSLTIVCILNAIFGCSTAFSPNYLTYLLLRVLTGFSTGGVGLCAFVLATEPIGPTKRGAAGMSTFYFFSTGIVIISGIAYLSQSTMENTSPTGLSLYSMKKKYESNGKQDYKEELELKEAITGSIVDVIKSPVTRIRLFLAVTINFLCSVVYYGLSLNVVNLDTNIYFNVALNAVAEMPAFLITALLLDRFGRKPLAIGTIWFSGNILLDGCIGERRWDMEHGEDGLRDFGDIRYGWNLQFTVYIHYRVVPYGGEKCSAWVRNTGSTNGSDIGTVCGGIGRYSAICGVCSVWNCGRSVRVLPTGNT
ncbi:hypothetical protein LWI28_004377 [Acer negundo]|uniref:Major facilitator superfamily (MFS) profile domain-containing protein n=1 Tax=Acer negundo TaxID=4023 RepID=A0AAD5J4E8_ACENE|nr:hypothetical protein LWI28_004377 [Acer negundo]